MLQSNNYTKIVKAGKLREKWKGSLVGSITGHETLTDSLVSILQVYCTMVFGNIETIIIYWQEIIKQHDCLLHIPVHHHYHHHHHQVH